MKYLSDFVVDDKKVIILSGAMVNTCDVIFYAHDGELYAPCFPHSWAENHLPGTGPKECSQCKTSGSWNGVFIGYCICCSQKYMEFNPDDKDKEYGRFLRGHGLHKTSEYIMEFCEDMDDSSAAMNDYLAGVQLCDVGFTHGKNWRDAMTLREFTKMAHVDLGKYFIPLEQEKKSYDVLVVIQQ